jgi:hypothetical protein
MMMAQGPEKKQRQRIDQLPEERLKRQIDRVWAFIVHYRVAFFALAAFVAVTFAGVSLYNHNVEQHAQQERAAIMKQESIDNCMTLEHVAQCACLDNLAIKHEASYGVFQGKPITDMANLCHKQQDGSVLHAAKKGGKVLKLLWNVATD